METKNREVTCARVHNALLPQSGLVGQSSDLLHAFFP